MKSNKLKSKILAQQQALKAFWSRNPVEQLTKEKLQSAKANSYENSRRH